MIGVVGDAAIYSVPKTLRVPDGGVLTLSGSTSLSASQGECASFSSVAASVLSLIKCSVLRTADRMGMYPLLPKCLICNRHKNDYRVAFTPSKLPEMPENYYYDRTHEDAMMSSFSHYILQRTSAASIVERRRENFLRPYNAIKKFYDCLPDGVCPLCLPILAENSMQLCKNLNDRSIAAIQWWSGFHSGLDWSGFPEAKYLKENVLAITIHQQLTFEQVDYISEALIHLLRAAVN